MIPMVWGPYHAIIVISLSSLRCCLYLDMIQALRSSISMLSNHPLVPPQTTAMRLTRDHTFLPNAAWDASKAETGGMIGGSS